ncbi:tetratricopeptide repeat protein [Methylomonas sp. 11b]|uniref:tetratricopeptide repeat protein n=1 Tax=Methylomonas sp. 11b TaxID=1168169 RepID=UPI00047A8B7F|nr:SEL1-like repeat protein [Methylomonas sp. 11b]
MIKFFSSRIKLVRIILYINLSSGWNVWAGANDRIKDCNNYPINTKAVQFAAEEGVPYCQALLGQLLWRGTGIEKNEKLAVQWSQRSLESVEPLGYYNKGVIYLYGLGGVIADNQVASQAFRVARGNLEKITGQIDPNYEFVLGSIIYNGFDGNQKNPIVGCAHYLNAANMNHPVAQHNYGSCLEDGSLGSKDIGGALHWYKLSASNGYSSSAWKLGEIQSVNGSPKEAYDSFALASKIGNSDDKLRWAGMLENGSDIVDKDIGTAAMAYKSASDSGSIHATYRLAWLYFIGDKSFSKDVNIAKKLFQQAAQGGDKDAINMVKALADYKK